MTTLNGSESHLQVERHAKAPDPLERLLDSELLDETWDHVQHPPKPTQQGDEHPGDAGAGDDLSLEDAMDYDKAAASPSSPYGPLLADLHQIAGHFAKALKGLPAAPGPAPSAAADALQGMKQELDRLRQQYESVQAGLTALEKRSKKAPKKSPKKR